MPTPTPGAPAVAPCGRCGRRHRSWRVVASCRWPSAEWAGGDPPFGGECFASVSLCGGRGRSGPTVLLYATEAAARAAKGLIDRLGCGGGCRRLHRVVRLRRPE